MCFLFICQILFSLDFLFSLRNGFLKTKDISLFTDVFITVSTVKPCVIDPNAMLLSIAPLLNAPRLFAMNREYVSYGGRLSRGCAEMCVTHASWYNSKAHAHDDGGGTRDKPRG